jgi:hypothetical protein
MIANVIRGFVADVQGTGQTRKIQQPQGSKLVYIPAKMTDAFVACYLLPLQFK